MGPLAPVSLGSSEASQGGGFLCAYEVDIWKFLAFFAICGSFFGWMSGLVLVDSCAKALKFKIEVCGFLMMGRNFVGVLAD